MFAAFDAGEKYYYIIDHDSTLLTFIWVIDSSYAINIAESIQ